MQLNLLLTCLLYVGILPFSTIQTSDSRPAADNEIHWMSWEEAVEANKLEPKKILVDVFTDWCHWCRVMDQKTFSKEDIITYVNQHFYAVKLNAEGKEDIQWNEQVFSYQADGRRGSHQLASTLLDGLMSYPSFVFLTEDYQKIRISKGFKPAVAFLEELKFAAEEQYKQMTE